MPPINFTGLASGLDTRALIDAILQAERKPVERLQARQAVFNQRRSAFDELRAKLQSLDGALRDLSSARTFRGRVATVSDESVLRATPSAGAEAGNFSIVVDQLATAHKVKSNGLAAQDQGLVADGTITLQSGTDDLLTLEVAAATGNNSLQAVRDAINAADAGVQASIIFDGADYLLTVRAKETGTANGLTITDSTNLGLADAGNEVSAALDAEIEVDGIGISASSNKISGVIPGVTLDLLAETSGTPLTVEIAQDVDSVVDATKTLVAKYNDVLDFFNEQNDRDKPGALAGDATARNILLRLESHFTGGLSGLPAGSIRSLSSVGVSFDGRTGKATLDAGELRELLETDFEEVGDLFLSSGRTSHPRVQFGGASSSTVEGDHAISITQAAEQATVAASTQLAALAGDESLTIAVGSSSVTVALTAGQTLADVVETLNARLRASGVEATAADDGGRLRITSRTFGSGVALSVSSDLSDPADGSQTGFDSAAATDSGVDVAGSIGGAAATGSGQTLTGGPDLDSSGLVLRVTANAAELAGNGGDFGTVSYSRGLIDGILRQVDAFTEFDSGILDLTRQGLDDDIERMGRDIQRIEERLQLREARLVKTFAAAERAISALQAQQARLGGA